MSRVFPLLAAIVVIVVSGFVDGQWTRRAEKSAELEQAVTRLDRIPETVGNWRARRVPDVDAEELELAGAEGAWIRRFTATNNDSVLVVLLVGRAGNMSVHRPESCYPGAGYDQAGSSVRYAVNAVDGSRLAECWTSRFSKPEVASASHLRIFWSWYAGGKWQAPGWPRWEFAHLPCVYKLYVIRETNNRPETLDNEPAVKFMQQFLPKLAMALDPG
jgi:hypothetical protein